MGYTIEISEAEMDSLRWIAARYDYAQVLLAVLDGDGPEYTMPEYAAWEFGEAVEAEDGWLPCMGGELEGKVAALLESII